LDAASLPTSTEYMIAPSSAGSGNSTMVQHYATLVTLPSMLILLLHWRLRQHAALAHGCLGHLDASLRLAYPATVRSLGNVAGFLESGAAYSTPPYHAQVPAAYEHMPGPVHLVTITNSSSLLRLQSTFKRRYRVAS
jgi:hypothetical protein